MCIRDSYGDTYLRIDYGAVARSWQESALPAVMAVLRNDGRWDTSNARFQNGRVLAYDKSVSYTHLDVYKRQSASCAGWRAMPPPTMSLS